MSTSGARRRAAKPTLVLLQLLVFLTYIFGPTASLAEEPTPEPSATESTVPEATSEPTVAPEPSLAPEPTAAPSVAPEPTLAPQPTAAPATPAPAPDPSEPAPSDSPEPSSDPEPTAAPAPGTRPYVITFASGTDEARQVEILADASATDVSSIPQLTMRSILLADTGYLEQLDALRANADVLRVEADRTRDVEAAPSDTSFTAQWSLPQIGWDQLYGSVGILGSSTVAILDTGVDASHPDLDGVVLPGHSVLEGSDPWVDLYGH